MYEAFIWFCQIVLLCLPGLLSVTSMAQCSLPTINHLTHMEEKEVDYKELYHKVSVKDKKTQ